MLNEKEMSAVIINFNHTLSVGKANLATYIRDKNISLDDRWKMFCKAPMQMRNTDSYIVTFNWEKKYHEISWYDSFGYDRYATVDMEDVITAMWENEENNEEELKDMKEEILEKNLGSFIYDW